MRGILEGLAVPCVIPSKQREKALFLQGSAVAGALCCRALLAKEEIKAILCSV